MSRTFSTMFLFQCISHATHIPTDNHNLLRDLCGVGPSALWPWSSVARLADVLPPAPLGSVSDPYVQCRFSICDKLKLILWDEYIHMLWPHLIIVKADVLWWNNYNEWRQRILKSQFCCFHSHYDSYAIIKSVCILIFLSRDSREEALGEYYMRKYAKSSSGEQWVFLKTEPLMDCNACKDY